MRITAAAVYIPGVEAKWVDQSHISEQVTAPAEILALADCRYLKGNGAISKDKPKKNHKITTAGS